ncbi:MAG: alpha/beta hydrolase [Betaproteobacteria bacterium]|nr:alpha/beta hydrolase [Betaproteobacteria bacterium]
MPFLKRQGKPTLHYLLDDYTDPWKNAGTVFLQHGYGRSAQFWYSWVPYLSRFYKVVRLDLRGFGQSPVDFDPDTGITLEGHMEDVVALLDHLGLESVHYCGESFGGILGMVLAATHPRRVRTLSLVASPVNLHRKHLESTAFGYASREEALRKMGARKWAAAMNDLNRFPPGTDPALLEWFASEMGKNNVDVLCAQYRLHASASAKDHLPRIEAPVLGLYPTSGPITTDEQEKLLRAGIRNLRLIHLPVKTHAVATLMPATCAQHVLHFAAQHDGIPCHE